MAWNHRIARLLGQGRKNAGAANPSLDRLRPLAPEARAHVPEADMIQARFDVADAPAASELLLILSTQRSGSTFLCEQLAALDYCYAHEYFQHFQYMQILAERWDFAGKGTVDWELFAAALRRHRTAPTGILAINLHGSHLDRFERAAAHLADLPTRYLHVTRRDIVGQALSFHEARQSSQWSAHFAKVKEPEYSYPGTRKALEWLQEQNARISAYLAARGVAAESVVYEELVADPAAIIARITGREQDHVREQLQRERPTSTRPQRKPAERRRRARQFALDYLRDTMI